MKYTKLYSAKDDKSYFEECDAGFETTHPLGNYSQKYGVKALMFREFEEGAVFDWHTAPQPQYIIYLEGKVEVEASSGEKRIFRPGDVLFATDLTGKGHVTKTLTKGRSVIITSKESECYIIKEIVSGGQTGVDRAALDVAIELGITHSGWCPFGRKAEDGIIPLKYKLKETPSSVSVNYDPSMIYRLRTELNVIDSDASLVIAYDNNPKNGTLCTIELLEKYCRPYFLLSFSDFKSVENAANWLAEHKFNKLNIAGPRESEAPGIYLQTYNTLNKILSCKIN